MNNTEEDIYTIPPTDGVHLFYYYYCILSHTVRPTLDIKVEYLPLGRPTDVWQKGKKNPKQNPNEKIQINQPKKKSMIDAF